MPLRPDRPAVAASKDARWQILVNDVTEADECFRVRTSGRYSEDIDLVQVNAGPIGPIMKAIRAKLDPWLGRSQWKQGAGRVTLYYRFDSEMKPVTPMRLKVEIATREHFTVLGFKHIAFSVESPWFRGSADVLITAWPLSLFLAEEVTL